MRALDFAIQDLGYTEYPPGTNRTKYGVWYGMNGVPWCMEAVQYWFDVAETPLPYKTASCSDLLAWYRRNAPERVVAEPQANDIAIFKFGHTGIVESAAGDMVTCIEGNTSLTSDDNGGKVMRRTRAISQVAGFIRAVDLAVKPQMPESGSNVETEEEMKRYDHIEDMPEEWREDVQRLIDRGALRGKDGGKLDLTEDMVRVLRIMQRMFDEK